MSTSLMSFLERSRVVVESSSIIFNLSNMSALRLFKAPFESGSASATPSRFVSREIIQSPLRRSAGTMTKLDEQMTRGRNKLLCFHCPTCPRTQ